MRLIITTSKQAYHLFILIFLFVLLVSLSHAQESELESANRSNIQRFVDEVYNRGNLNVLEILFAEDVLGYPGERDRSDFAASVIGLRAAMPDLYAEPTVIVVENNWLAFQLLLRGTFVNEMVFADSLPIPPTDKEIQFVINMALQTNAQGQVVEYWTGFDNLSFLAQIEFIPKPETLWQGNTEYIPLIQTGQEDANKLTTLQYYNAWQDRNFGALEQQLSQDFVAYNPFGSFDTEGQISDLSKFRDAFPDYAWQFHTVIGEGNYVVVVHTITGTFANNFVLGDSIVVPPTNKSLNLVRVDFLRFDEEGLIAETWELYDVWDFLTQLEIPFEVSN